MLSLKLFFKYFAVIVFAGLLGGILLHVFHSVFFDKFLDPRPGIIFSIITGSITSFIVYNIYKFILSAIWHLGIKHLLIKAVSCYLIVIFLSIILGVSTFGYNLIGFVYTSLTLGISNSLIPYLDVYFDEILKLSVSSPQKLIQ